VVHGRDRPRDLRGAVVDRKLLRRALAVRDAAASEQRAVRNMIGAGSTPIAAPARAA
jgi:hypothetical protein